MGSEGENKERVRAFFEALSAGDAERLRELMLPDVRWVVPEGAAMLGGTHAGAEDVIAKMAAAVGQTFRPGSNRAQIRLMLAEDEAVMAETRITATHTDGRRYENRYVFVFEFRDGRIAELREHVDTVVAARFFGV
ncbi:MAG: nuclear transport factor 2 family protein [Proteobacteria bacterium]|nr:nuclear transport factor 2 family protein [Pseudomonadota bacterium]